MTRTQIALFAASVGILATLFVADNREHEIHQRHYCEMVQIHEDTGGEYGWPAYDEEVTCPR